MFKLKSPALLAASQLVLNFMKEKEIFESPVGWGCVTLVSLETCQLQLYEVDDIPWTNFFFGYFSENTRGMLQLFDLRNVFHLMSASLA